MIPLIERAWARVLEWFLPVLVAVVDTIAMTWLWLELRIGMFGAWFVFVWAAIVVSLALALAWSLAIEALQRVGDAVYRWRVRRRLRIVHRRDIEKDEHMRALAKAMHGGPPNAA